MNDELERKLTELVSDQSCYGAYHDSTAEPCQVCPVNSRCKTKKTEDAMNVTKVKKVVSTTKAPVAETPAAPEVETPAPAQPAAKAEKVKPAPKPKADKVEKTPKADKPAKEPKPPKEKGKPGPKGRRYDPKGVEKASWLSIVPPMELPDLTKGEKLMSKMLHDELGCEMVLHSDNTPRYFRLKGGDCRALHIHGTPGGVALCYRDKRVWLGEPEKLVEAIKAHLKANPAPVRTPPVPPQKGKKAPKAEKAEAPAAEGGETDKQ